MKSQLTNFQSCVSPFFHAHLDFGKFQAVWSLQGFLSLTKCREEIVNSNTTNFNILLQKWGQNQLYKIFKHMPSCKNIDYLLQRSRCGSLNMDPPEMLRALRAECLLHSLCHETRPQKKGEFWQFHSQHNFTLLHKNNLWISIWIYRNEVY